MAGISSWFDDLEIKENGRLHVPEQGLIDLALKLLELYIDNAPSYSAGRPSRRDAIFFYKAAEIVKSRGLTPEEFITQRLRRMAELNLLWPRAIAGEVFDESEQTNNARSLERIRHYKAQLDLFENRSSLYGSENAVRDMSNPFSPVVRYYLAKKLGLDDVMKSFEALAKDELLASREARETFDEI
jgi:hypothetical protein